MPTFSRPSRQFHGLSWPRVLFVAVAWYAVFTGLYSLDEQYDLCGEAEQQLAVVRLPAPVKRFVSRYAPEIVVYGFGALLASVAGVVVIEGIRVGWKRLAVALACWVAVALSVLITFDGDHRAILFHLVGWDGRLDRSDYYLVETLLAVPTAVLGTLAYCLFRPGAWRSAGDSATTMT